MDWNRTVASHPSDVNVIYINTGQASRTPIALFSGLYFEAPIGNPRPFK